MPSKKIPRGSARAWSTLEIGTAIATIIGTVVAVLAWRLPVPSEPNERPASDRRIAEGGGPALPASVATSTTEPPLPPKRSSAQPQDNIQIDQKIGGKGNVGVGVMNGGITINNR